MKLGDGKNLLENYKLVLVDEDENPDKADTKKIDLRELFRYLWVRRKSAIKFVSIFVVIGVIYALMSTVEYSAGAKLLPQLKSGSINSGAAGSLLKKYGSIIGLGAGLDLGDRGTVIPPNLYPDIVYSIPFQLTLLNSEINISDSDTSVILYDYFHKVLPNTTKGKIKRYTIGLVGEVLSNFFEEQEQPPLPVYDFEGGLSIVKLNKKQARTIKKLKERISIYTDPKIGIVYVEVEMPDPQAAAELGKITINLLTKYISEYKTRKSSEDLIFAKNQLDEAKKEFKAIQGKLANFRDSNLGTLTALAKSKENELQSEYELKFNIYNLLAEQVENAKLKLQEDTPLFETIQPIQLPYEKSKPKRKLIVIAFVMIGFIIWGIRKFLSFIKEFDIKLI